MRGVLAAAVAMVWQGRHGRVEANTWDHNDNELRVLNWAIVFVISLVLVSAGIWAWIRRQPD